MGNIGDSFSQVVPPVSTQGPDYANTINAILTEVMTRLTAKVPLASLNLNSSFSLGGNPLTNAGYVTLTNAATDPAFTPSPVNRVTAFGGNLYYVSPAGAVQMTTGAALNSASIGGITGTYGGASPAQFRHDAIATRYDAYENFGTGTWAYIRALGFDVAAGATSAVFARILFGGASNLTFTLPPTVSSSGQRDLSIDTAGNITTGFSARELLFTPYTYTVFAGAAADMGNTGASGAVQTTNTNAPTVYWPLTGLRVGTRITSVVVGGFKNTTASTSLALMNDSGTIFSTSSTTSGNNTYTLTGAAHTIPTAKNYWVRVIFPAVAAETVNRISVFVDQPT